MRPSLLPQCLKQPHLLRWTPRLLQRTPRRIATTSSNNAAPTDIPKLVISPGSKHHDSLPSFLAYAKAKNLGPEKTVYIGTHYEYAAALSLLRLGFSLLRIGKKNDAGIDLIGHWVLPPLREPMPTIIQCKARKISATPSHVRELEGSFQGIPPSWRGKDVLGLLVTTCKATKGTLEALGGSRFPLGFLLVTRAGVIQQFVWNRAAADRGLQGVGVTLRHTPQSSMMGDEVVPSDAGKTTTNSKSKLKKSKSKSKIPVAGTIKDIQLTWQGTPISPQRTDLSSDTLSLLSGMNDDMVARNEPKLARVQKDMDSKGGRPRTKHTAPTPRGGVIGRKRASKETSVNEQTPLKVPKASKKSATAAPEPPKRGRGRPRGSKNKPKPDPKDEG